MSKAIEYVRQLAKERQENQHINMLDSFDFSLELAKFSLDDIVYESDIKILQDEGLISDDNYLMYGGRISADLQEPPQVKEMTPEECIEKQIEPTPREEVIVYEL